MTRLVPDLLAWSIDRLVTVCQIGPNSAHAPSSAVLAASRLAPPVGLARLGLRGMDAIVIHARLRVGASCELRKPI